MSQCRYSPLVNAPPTHYYLQKKPGFFTKTNFNEMISPHPETNKKGEHKPLLADHKKILPSDFKSITTKLKSIIDSFFLSEGTYIPFHELHVLVKQCENLVSDHTYASDDYTQSLKSISSLEDQFKNTQHLTKIMEITTKLKHQLSPKTHTLIDPLMTPGL